MKNERAKFQEEKDNFKEMITNSNEEAILKDVPYLQVTKHLKIDGTEFNKTTS